MQTVRTVTRINLPLTPMSLFRAAFPWTAGALALLAFLAWIIPVAHRDQVRREAEWERCKGAVLAALQASPVPLTAEEASRAAGLTVGCRRARALCSSLERDGAADRQRVMDDGSPARWWDGALGTRTVFTSR
jgi:hypothetical protein